MTQASYKDYQASNNATAAGNIKRWEFESKTLAEGESAAAKLESQFGLDLQAEKKRCKELETAAKETVAKMTELAKLQDQIKKAEAKAKKGGGKDGGDDAKAKLEAQFKKLEAALAKPQKRWEKAAKAAEDPKLAKSVARAEKMNAAATSGG